MDYLKKDDLFKVTKPSNIGNDDIEVVTKLYQPIMGYKSLSLYLTFISINTKVLKKHEYLYNIMQITPSDFLLARKTLEAVGLIKSFKNSENIFVYQVFPPLSPKDFFNDYLFKGMIIKYVGEDTTLELASLYKVNTDLKDYKEITTPFSEVFSFNLNDSSFNSSILDKINLKKNNPIQIIGEFSGVDLVDKLKAKTQISITAISDYEINEIVRISALYGIKLDDIVPLVEECFDSKRKYGTKIDLVALNKKSNDIAKYTAIDTKNKNKSLIPISISGKTKLADELNLICDLSPREYLSYKQDGAPVANADLKILNVLSTEYKLSTDLINVLIYYGLKECNNVLSLNYLTKVAGSLKRGKFDNPIDALNYLEGNRGNITKQHKTDKGSVVKKEGKSEERDDEFEEALKFLRGKK